MTDFAKDIDLRGNKIKRAKIDIADRNQIESDDAIDKQYVDDVDIYETSITANPALQPSHGIEDRTLLHQKPTKEIFDNLFYPIVLHSYVKPTLAASARYVEPGTNIDVDITPGKEVDVILEGVVTLNDSEGVAYYEYSGSGIAGTVNTTSSTYLIPNYIVENTQSWQIDVKYLGALTALDSRGNDDEIGAPGALKFDSGMLTEKIEVNLPFAYYALSISGNIAFPSANTLNALLENGKVITELTNELEVAVPSGNTYTTFIAIPSNTIKQLSIVKDNSQSMTESFSSTLVYNVVFGQSSVTYAVYRATNGIGYTNNSTYNIKILD